MHSCVCAEDTLGWHSSGASTVFFFFSLLSHGLSAAKMARQAKLAYKSPRDLPVSDSPALWLKSGHLFLFLFPPFLFSFPFKKIRDWESNSGHAGKASTLWTRLSQHPKYVLTVEDYAWVVHCRLKVGSRHSPRPHCSRENKHMNIFPWFLYIIQHNESFLNCPYVKSLFKGTHTKHTV